jgi:predicted MFS family arabinose efflux permease
MSQLAEVRRSMAAVAGNRRLLRAQAAYALFAVNELTLWVAVLLWAYSAGGTALAGLVAVLELAPAAALAPVGGYLGDRLARDRALRLTYTLQAVAIAVLAALVAAHAPTAAVVAAAVLSTIVVGWSRPPHYAAAAELSSDPGEAAAANALSAILENVGFFAGPALAGIGVAVGGYPAVLAGCAALAAIAAGLVSGIRLERPPPAQPEGGAPPGGGLAPLGLVGALLRRPAVATVLLLIGAQFIAASALELFALGFTQRQLGQGQTAAGLLIGAVGIGGTVGALLSAVLVGWRRLSGAVSGSLVLAGVPLLAMPHLHSLVAAVGIVVVTGAGVAFFAVASITLLQRSVDLGLVARVLAARESASLAGLALGAAVAPLLVRSLGAGRAYAALGIALAVLAAAAWPMLVRMERAAIYRPEILSLLRGVNFLSVLGPRALEGLALRAQEVQVAAGTVVVREGDAGDAYYLVQGGQLEVSVQGNPARVVLGPGDGFGEIALLRDVPRTATVRATEDCRLWSIDRNAFLVTVANSTGADLASQHVDMQLGRLAPGSTQRLPGERQGNG